LVWKTKVGLVLNTVAGESSSWVFGGASRNPNATSAPAKVDTTPKPISKVSMLSITSFHNCYTLFEAKVFGDEASNRVVS
jgi:hypothetical protein